jgi:hypothetical protein
MERWRGPQPGYLKTHPVIDVVYLLPHASGNNEAAPIRRAYDVRFHYALHHFINILCTLQCCPGSRRSVRRQYGASTGDVSTLTLPNAPPVRSWWSICASCSYIHSPLLYQRAVTKNHRPRKMLKESCLLRQILPRTIKLPARRTRSPEGPQGQTAVGTRASASEPQRPVEAQSVPTLALAT